VWSAPNYCYRCGNIATVLKLDENLNKTWEMFKEAPESNLPEIYFLGAQ
jgi:serine/threonine-protein phosphatase 4 catalytic subunit